MGFGETVADEEPGSVLIEERLRSVKNKPALELSKNASADRFMRGAHHR
jgi:hypothetical protein